jgi:dienelactone hydrolase
MPKDANLQTVIAHWTHRFTANGVVYSDYAEVTDSIDRWDEWCRAWSERAAVHEAIGREALAKGQSVTAGEALDRAGVYYHFAKFLFVKDPAQMKAAHMKAVECRQLSLPHINPPGERVEIPYEGKKLAGILRKPRGVARPPIVLMAMGLDSCKEEMETNEQVFLQRGLATLVFEGPGQGEAEYDFAIRGDYEAVTSAVIDHVMTRKDIDSARIGMWGVSLGGYYAPRSAAFEKRIKACIGLAGPYEWSECWDTMPVLTREAFIARSRSKTIEEAKQAAAKLSLKGVAQNITCPLLIVMGKLDRLIPYTHAERLVREVRGAELLLIEDGNHVVSNRPYRYRPQSGDWMARHLAG